MNGYRTFIVLLIGTIVLAACGQRVEVSQQPTSESGDLASLESMAIDESATEIEPTSETEERLIDDEFINNPFPFEISFDMNGDFSFFGEPVSDVIGNNEGAKMPPYSRTITFDGITITLIGYPPDTHFFDTVYPRYRITDDRWALINGLTVGSSVGEVKSMLGPPDSDWNNAIIYFSSEHNQLSFDYEGDGEDSDRITEVLWLRNY